MTRCGYFLIDEMNHITIVLPHQSSGDYVPALPSEKYPRSSRGLVMSNRSVTVHQGFQTELLERIVHRKRTKEQKKRNRERLQLSQKQE